jgi:hypothetical protein
MSTTDTILQDLVDRNEITDLVSRLGMILDEARFDELPALLADDVSVTTPGGTAHGPDAVVAQARRNHRPELGIQHVITNLLIDLAGDQAQARANLLAHFGTPTDPPTRPAPVLTYTLGEVYHFALTRTPDGWRIARITTTPTWYSGTPLRPPAAEDRA